MNGLVQFLNNDQVDALRAEQDGKVNATPANPNDRLMGRLDAHILRCWEAAQRAKNDIELEMIEDLYRRMGRYTPTKLAEIIADGGVPIFMNITATKCRAAEGWMMDIAMPAAERPFSVAPSPIPDMPDDIKNKIRGYVLEQFQQAIMAGEVVSSADMFAAEKNLQDKVLQHAQEEAEERAERMEVKIDDLCVEGDWYRAIEDCVSYMITFHSCILKGPVIHKRKQLSYEVDQGGGKYRPIVTEKLVPVFYAVDPLKFYPSPNARNPNEGYHFELMPMRRGALYDCIGMAGFNDEKLRAAIEEYHDGYTIETSISQEVKNIERMQGIQEGPDRMIDVLVYNGFVSGKDLKEWGHEGDLDPAKDYDVDAWRVGRHTVRAVINDHPLGRRPYTIASFDRRPNSIWGWGGLPRMVRDIQDICNAAARSLCFNMAMASGPQVSVNVDRLAEGQPVNELSAWQIWQTKEAKVNTTSPAIDFFQPQMIAGTLQQVFDYFSVKADEYTGIPAYATGVPSNVGAAGTASGMSMLMGMATRQMKRVVANLDRVIEDSIQSLHTHVMLYDPDESCKGDSWIRPLGAQSLVVKEARQMRLKEFLMETNNETDMSIIGPEGRAEMLREMIKNFDIPIDKIIPSREAILLKAKQAMMAEMAASQPPAAGQALAPDGQPAGGVDANLMQGGA